MIISISISRYIILRYRNIAILYCDIAINIIIKTLCPLLYYIEISLYISQYIILRYRDILYCDIAIYYIAISRYIILRYRSITNPKSCMHAYIFTCRQMTLTKKIVSRIRNSRAGSPYRRKLRYPKFNFILFPFFPIFSLFWVSQFCACHSEFDWNQFFTKNFIIWQESHTLQKLHLCVKRPYLA